MTDDRPKKERIEELNQKVRERVVDKEGEFSFSIVVGDKKFHPKEYSRLQEKILEVDGLQENTE